MLTLGGEDKVKAKNKQNILYLISKKQLGKPFFSAGANRKQRRLYHLQQDLSSWSVLAEPRPMRLEAAAARRAEDHGRKSSILSASRILARCICCSRLTSLSSLASRRRPSDHMLVPRPPPRSPLILDLDACIDVL